jgi:hypothetical protein
MLLEREKATSSIRRLSHAFVFALISCVLGGAIGAQMITTVAGTTLPATSLPGVAADNPMRRGRSVFVPLDFRPLLVWVSNRSIVTCAMCGMHSIC